MHGIPFVMEISKKRASVPSAPVPLGTVRRIMGADKGVKHVSKDSVVLHARATVCTKKKF